MSVESLDLLALRNELAEILDTVSTVARRVYKPPIIYEPEGEGAAESADDEGLVPGLKAFEGTVEKEIDVLDKFLDRNPGTPSSGLSTNAPYFTSVWKEVLAASEVTAIGQTFKIQQIRKSALDERRSGNCGLHKGGPVDMELGPKQDSNSSTSQHRLLPQVRTPSVKIDVVTDRGNTWIRVNTIKNNRLRAELNDIDGYADEDSDGTDSEGTNGSDNNAPVNSLLQMASNLLAAARCNPIPGTNRTPNIFLRLTRLVPDNSEPRIAETIDALRKLGIGVWLGERQLNLQQARAEDVDCTLTALSPTIKLNLDLSLLVALVSDITHAPLPATIEEAVNRFRPLVKRWNRGPETAEDYPAWVLSGNKAPLGGAAAHSRSLSIQVEQEKRLGLLEELRRRLLPALEADVDPEFYTTTEAAGRLKGIVDKIGGTTEKKRAGALTGLLGTSESMFYEGSRFKPGWLRGLVPLRVINEDASDIVGSRIRGSDVSTFQSHLAQTCRTVLGELDGCSTPHSSNTPINEDAAALDQQPDITSTTLDSFEPRQSAVGKGSKKDRHKRDKDLTANSVSPALTRHTVRSMLLGAESGMTTVTANKTSVRAILREMKKRGSLGSKESCLDSGHHASVNGDNNGLSENEREVDEGPPAPANAAIWVVEPRSLAENMRADRTEDSPSDPVTKTPPTAVEKEAGSQAPLIGIK
ncbi:hypothetical protein FRB95_003287 [Tulasnella sp. JGI-2019a]|nr:hypothetical protein FRB95_003287 [Tulasnella sp. JGI-2019a]